MKIGVGLFGNNGGHQIHGELVNHPYAQIVATAAMDTKLLAPEQQFDTDIRHYESLEDLLKDERVQVVSLCSPRRSNQVNEAIMCMQQGRHVYAEKPCALHEEELDLLLQAVNETGCCFREMAGTGFQQPYLAIRNQVLSGVIGEVVQVFAQKSYPYHDGRPQDEAIDGGLIGQNGIHAIRFVEHVACVQIKEIHAMETKLGNPCEHGGLHMAASMLMRLDNGGVASIVANYLNPKGFGGWGNEHLRIFGTKGFIEAVDGGARTRLVVGDHDWGPVDISQPEENYWNRFIQTLLGRAEMPVTLEDELHCTRMAIRAKKSANQQQTY
ncbi:Predicted dehydrogenase [Paenibacillus sp. 1_12]|uniref:Gfo/Idh/MocA family protein n=1 Tax=Paenibacillus sp. 1_12 TaxID=1566278 RepID=UPI0008E311F0|nr:Gfo/Idh/MocA family oxidoreductase [Paenibacillus sp. 1_12]SFL57276.1 Predicted dehydrogenase [Paenibacillus sp. 1_12]